METTGLKYYYYHYLRKNGFGCGTCYSDGAGFPISYVTEDLRKNTGKDVAVSFWNEISPDEYEAFNDIMDRGNNGDVDKQSGSNKTGYEGL